MNHLSSDVSMREPMCSSIKFGKSLPRVVERRNVVAKQGPQDFSIFK